MSEVFFEYFIYPMKSPCDLHGCIGIANQLWPSSEHLIEYTSHLSANLRSIIESTKHNVGVSKTINSQSLKIGDYQAVNEPWNSIYQTPFGMVRVTPSLFYHLDK
ncbi:unnamed protein product [Leptosia nina]|uniref:Uncharacterized protein n=1 Tax=Leptosia nina TaxID=320188 RepID=A0AAV1K0Z4_9NEOP